MHKYLNASSRHNNVFRAVWAIIHGNFATTHDYLLTALGTLQSGS